MKDYIAYKCQVCGMEFAISTDGLRIAEVNSKYLSCPLGCRPIKEIDEFDSLKECMEKANTYDKKNGRVIQTR